MAKISKKGLEKAIKRYLTSLEPVVKGAVTSAEAHQNPDGTVTVKEQRGDIFMDVQQASSLAKSLSSAIDDHISLYVHETVVSKLNELIAQYNQLRTDIIAVPIATTSNEVDEIPLT